jgi:hemolysin activation/secretion protein
LLEGVTALVLLMSVGAIQAQPTDSAVVAADEPAPRFDVWEYRVLGNSVLLPSLIEAAVYPHLGADKTIETVEQARQALELLYKNQGYGTVFVDIPEQDVDAGVVRLRVTEGRLDRVRISGARYFANGKIREMLPALERGTVPKLTDVQAQLAQVNRQSRDRQVTPVLRAGRTPGTVDVELKVEDELPLHAALEANDRYSADTSRTRLNLNLSYDNLFQDYHSLSLQYQTAPEEPKEARVIAATYVAPVGPAGNLLAAYAVDTDSDVATVGTLAVLGAGRIYGMRYIVPLKSHSGRYHSLSLGVDYKDFEEQIRLIDGASDQTPIEYVSWSAHYGGGERTEHTSTAFSLGANLGIRGLANDPQEFEFKRFKAEPGFFHLRGSAEHERPWLLGSRLYLRLAGQFTTAPLISNEQFAIGGAESVRGFLESDELGDYGISGTLEWRTPMLSGWLGDWATDLHLLSFFDAGVVRIIDALPGQPSAADLSSWGFGLRFGGTEGLMATFDWADPLVPTNDVEAGDSRIHFQVRYGF